MDTQISLPADLKRKIERAAHARGMSLTDFVRASLESAVTREPNGDSQEPTGDSMFADDAVYRDEGPVDFASNHDDYLYGDGR